jgi:hypothetical protein
MRRTKERADSALCQPRCVHRHASPTAASTSRTAQAAHRLADGSIDGCVVQTLQETIESCEIGRARHPQCLAQLPVLAPGAFPFC